MLISVFAAASSGPTQIAAFDRALHVGNIADQNLIRLSSIVPPGSQIVRGPAGTKDHSVGDRLYCVMAESRSATRAAEAWAGLSWAMDEGGLGGVFVEAEGESEAVVRNDLSRSMRALIANRQEWVVSETDTEVIGIACQDEPVCALVVAIFASVSW